MPTIIRIIGTVLMSGGLAIFLLSWPIGQAPPAATSSPWGPMGPWPEQVLPVGLSPSPNAPEGLSPPDIPGPDELEAQAEELDIAVPSDDEWWDDEDQARGWDESEGWDESAEIGPDADSWDAGGEDGHEEDGHDEAEDATSITGIVGAHA